MQHLPLFASPITGEEEEHLPPWRALLQSGSEENSELHLKFEEVFGGSLAEEIPRELEERMESLEMGEVEKGKVRRVVREVRSAGGEGLEELKRSSHLFKYLFPSHLRLLLFPPPASPPPPSPSEETKHSIKKLENERSRQSMRKKLRGVSQKAAEIARDSILVLYRGGGRTLEGVPTSTWKNWMEGGEEVRTRLPEFDRPPTLAPHLYVDSESGEVRSHFSCFQKPIDSMWCGPLAFLTKRVGRRVAVLQGRGGGSKGRRPLGWVEGKLVMFDKHLNVLLDEVDDRRGEEVGGREKGSVFFRGASLICFSEKVPLSASLPD